MATYVQEYFLKDIMLAEIMCLYSVIKKKNKSLSEKVWRHKHQKKEEAAEFDLQEKEEKGEEFESMWMKAKSWDSIEKVSKVWKGNKSTWGLKSTRAQA